MQAKTLFSLLRNTLRKFRSARAGNVAIIFALATLPIIGGVGVAIDYSRANYVKAKMQSVLDATALMVSKEAATDTSSQLQANASSYFLAQFNPPEAQNITITATYSSTGGTHVVLNATASVPTTFAAILGINAVNLSDSSTVDWGSARLQVALVLDNTGSMGQSGKMPALQTAANSFLSQMNSLAVNNGDVVASIIPFDVDVNLGSSNYNQSWVLFDDGTDSSWDGTYGTCSISGYSPRSACVAQSSCSIAGKTSQSSCTGAGTCSISSKTSQSTCTAAGTCSISSKTSQSTCTAAGVCSNPGKTTQSSCTGTSACTNSSYTSSSKCTSHGYTWGLGTWTAGVWTAGVWTAGVWSAGIWTPNNHSTWNGCVADRGDSTGPDAGNYDTNVVEPTTSIAATLFPADQYSPCPQEVMGLSYNWSAMSSEINNMSPGGTTNQAIGLALGWMSLVGGGPFTVPAPTPGYTYQQIIILFTDGLNTQDRWYTVQSQIDARQTLTCNNIKAAGITLYTVQISTDGTPVSPLLQSCATDSSKFFYLTSSSQVVTTFNQIGTNIAQLFIAK